MGGAPHRDLFGRVICVDHDHVLISDGVIGLRPIQVGDARTHLAAEDAASARWRGGAAETLERVVEHFRECEQEWAVDGPGKTFAVVDLASATVIGTLDIHTERAYLAARQADVGYGIYPAWRRRGMAARAVVLACRYIAGRDLADEAVLRIDPDNTASVSVAHRVGFGYHHSTDDAEHGRLDWFIQAV